MNIIQKQAELGRSLFQINTNTLRSYAEMQRDNLSKYVELNSNYGKQLPEIKNVQDFLALQREYGQSVWSGVKSSVESQTSLVKSAFEETSVALKSAYTTDTATANAPVVETAEEKAPAKKSKAAQA